LEKVSAKPERYLRGLNLIFCEGASQVTKYYPLIERVLELEETGDEEGGGKEDANGPDLKTNSLRF